uniref:Uncharacterized protein n=1 Tax=Fagus sylvatica TaxID=28930 RepID=A0A2N9ICV5_FAGSY
MLTPGVSSTIGIRAKYLDRVTPPLLPAKCFGYLGGLAICPFGGEWSVFRWKGKCLASSTLSSLDASTWAHIGISPNCIYFWKGKCLASSTLSLDANTWGQFYYWYKSQVPGQGYASPPSCQMLWLPRWTGNMRGVYSVGRVSAWLVAPCLLLMLAPGGKCLASSTLSLDANTWGQFYYWYQSQVPGQGYASPGPALGIMRPGAVDWQYAPLGVRGVYSVGRVSAWLVAPCLLLMLAPEGKCLASSTLSLDANTWGQFYYWYKSQVPGQGYASPPSCQMLWLPRWTGNMRGVYSVGRVSAWLVAPCLLLMLAPGGKCLASSTLSLDANTWGQFLLLVSRAKYLDRVTPPLGRP